MSLLRLSKRRALFAREFVDDLVGLVERQVFVVGVADHHAGRVGAGAQALRAVQGELPVGRRFALVDAEFVAQVVNQLVGADAPCRRCCGRLPDGTCRRAPC